MHPCQSGSAVPLLDDQNTLAQEVQNELVGITAAVVQQTVRAATNLRKSGRTVQAARTVLSAFDDVTKKRLTDIDDCISYLPMRVLPQRFAARPNRSAPTSRMR